MGIFDTLAQGLTAGYTGYQRGELDRKDREEEQRRQRMQEQLQLMQYFAQEKERRAQRGDVEWQRQHEGNLARRDAAQQVETLRATGYPGASLSQQMQDDPGVPGSQYVPPVVEYGEPDYSTTLPYQREQEYIRGGYGPTGQMPRSGVSTNQSAQFEKLADDARAAMRAIMSNNELDTGISNDEIARRWGFPGGLAEITMVLRRSRGQPLGTPYGGPPSLGAGNQQQGGFAPWEMNMIEMIRNTQRGGGVPPDTIR